MKRNLTDRRLLQLLGTARLPFALTLLLGSTLGILIIFQALVLSRIIADVFLAGAALSGVWSPMLLLLAIMLGRAVLTWGSEATASQVAARCKRDVRAQLVQHLTALGPVYVRGERSGELINTAIEGVESLEPYLAQYLPQLVLAAILPVLILAFVFPFDLLSGIVLLLTGPLIPLFMILIGKAAEALTHRQFKSLNLMSAHLLDVLQGLTTLKLLGRSREQTQNIAEVSNRFKSATLEVLRVAFLSAFALEMIATISIAIVAVQVGLRLLYGQMLFEQAFFLLVLAPDFYAPLRLLGTRFHAGMAGTAAGQRIFEVLDTPVPAPQGSYLHSIPSPLPAISFDKVSYSYDGDRAALEDVSFVLDPGRYIALIGATGAGKSTVADLLLRFIQAERGEIRCGGVPLEAWSRDAWRAQVAWVPQTPYLFDDTVAANISLARPDAPLEEIERAARMAHADEFIRVLPQGYATRIGERGARLSGGQAQRLALARAFLKNAPLLILDEATANLDVENADLILAAAEELLRNRTALIITHDMSLIAHADEIIVLDGGRVVEDGTRAELLAQGGLYSRLVAAAQAEGIC